jgi:outer membrane protein
LKKLNNEVTDFSNAISLESNASRSALIYALEAFNVQEENLDLANSVSKTTKLKYEQGIGSNIEVLDAETSLKEAQVNYFRALFNAIIAKIDLERSLGNFKY